MRNFLLLSRSPFFFFPLPLSSMVLSHYDVEDCTFFLSLFLFLYCLFSPPLILFSSFVDELRLVSVFGAATIRIPPLAFGNACNVCSPCFPFSYSLHRPSTIRRIYPTTFVRTLSQVLRNIRPSRDFLHTLYTIYVVR